VPSPARAETQHNTERYGEEDCSAQQELKLLKVRAPGGRRKALLPLGTLGAERSAGGNSGRGYAAGEQTVQQVAEQVALVVGERGEARPPTHGSKSRHHHATGARNSPLKSRS
jgi:hypothetical protein